LEIPLVINGKKVKGDAQYIREVPSNHGLKLCKYNHASAEQLQEAIKGSMEAHKTWSRMSFYDRAAIFQRASQLLATKYRYDFMAVTMLCQSKNVWQAEIDAIAELLDFWRFGVKFAAQLYQTEQPLSPTHSCWNTIEHRPLEGFVCAISPFNFTAIGGNLGTVPALMGNTVIWKPSDAAIYSNYLIYQILEEAGLPAGVVNFVPCSAENISSQVLSNRNLGGIGFTGSTSTFDKIYKQVACNISSYKSYPKISGETGGKNFHLVHPTADLETVIATTVRSAFEYQGQKCSACSRMFVPKSKWNYVRDRLVAETEKLKVSVPEDFEAFVCAVIHEQSFNKCSEYINIAKNDKAHCKILTGGNPDKSKGWFVPPTIIETTDINCRLLKEEIFGPILTVYVYDDSKANFWEDICHIVDEQAEFALTGAMYCLDRADAIKAIDILRYTAGNFYINDKSTGSIVANQPFGGSRRSGTNDKPGSMQFLKTFTSPRSIKESFEPLLGISYPHQQK
jgi:1-pyrroline-5-carboxylate dehydrogenase